MCGDETRILKYPAYIKGFPRMCAECGKELKKDRWEILGGTGVEGAVMHKKCAKLVQKRYF